MATPGPSLYVGAISGTSVDGLDLAVVECGTGAVRIVSGTTVPFEHDLRGALLDLASSRLNDIDSLGALDVRLGRFIANAVLEFLARDGIDPRSIRAIGSHGQTVRHRPSGPWPFTLQIGDPNSIAELTGIETVADFRRRDLAAGGQAAPLVPLFHRALFAAPGESGVVLNLGGIGNITVLDGSASDPRGFDTGPGNMLLDAWISEQKGETHDADGAWGASGKVLRELLDCMLADSFFSQPPPKSTGREQFGMEWLRMQLAAVREGCSAVDVQATLAELTARTAADAIRRWGMDRGPVIVCGGGRLNRDVMRRLQLALPQHRVGPSESFGANGDWIEAAAFAWLAHRTLNRLPGSSPAVTGAQGPRVLGGVFADGSRRSGG